MFNKYKNMSQCRNTLQRVLNSSDRYH